MTVQVPGLLGQHGHLAQWMGPRELFLAATGDYPLEWQEDYLLYSATHDAVVLKGRQVGASTSAGVIAIRTARYSPGSFCAIVSPSQKQSTEVKERAKQGVLRLGDTLVKDNSTEIGFTNGSRIISLPGSAKSVRGWSCDLLVIDEAAFLDEETYLAARATVATGGRVIVQSTPNGPYGPFYDAWEEAAHTPTWKRYRVSSEDVPTISKEFLARERAVLGKDEYAQEYLGVFTNPGLGLIDPDRLASLTLKPDAQKAQDIWGRMRDR